MLGGRFRPIRPHAGPVCTVTAVLAYREENTKLLGSVFFHGISPLPTGSLRQIRQGPSISMVADRLLAPPSWPCVA